jgi:hypothetical protein
MLLKQSKIEKPKGLILLSTFVPVAGKTFAFFISLGARTFV